MRIATIVPVAAAIVLGTSVEAAAAKHRKYFARHHCACHVLHVAQVAAPTAPRVGPMRYYGGPKSPMWRAPVEN
jgi:hypothetical protein